MTFWNTSFGKSPNLQYPESLKEPLKALKNSIKIDLPTFETSFDLGSDENANPNASFETTQPYKMEDSPKSDKLYKPNFKSKVKKEETVVDSPKKKQKSNTNSSSGLSSNSLLKNFDSDEEYMAIPKNPNPTQPILTDHQHDIFEEQKKNYQFSSVSIGGTFDSFIFSPKSSGKSSGVSATLSGGGGDNVLMLLKTVKNSSMSDLSVKDLAEVQTLCAQIIMNCTEHIQKVSK